MPRAPPLAGFAAPHARPGGIFASTSLGCEITPVTALAAATAGLERYTRAFGCPIRPGKLRLVVLKQTSPSPSTPICPPRHAPQVAVVHAAPAARKVPIKPSLSAWMAT